MKSNNGLAANREPGRVVKALGLVLITVYCLLIPGQVFGQSSQPTDDQVNAVAHQLYCPVCENTPLDVCPTQACAQWRDTIRSKLAAGWSDQQIKDYFVQQYGERVLAQPSIDGFNIVLWIMAPLGVLTALGVGIYYLRSMHHPEPGDSAPAESTDEYTQRLEDELAKRR